MMDGLAFCDPVAVLISLAKVLRGLGESAEPLPEDKKPRNNEGAIRKSPKTLSQTDLETVED